MVSHTGRHASPRIQSPCAAAEQGPARERRDVDADADTSAPLASPDVDRPSLSPEVRNSVSTALQLSAALSLLFTLLARERARSQTPNFSRKQKVESTAET
jgi:hypothetical protein